MSSGMLNFNSNSINSQILWTTAQQSIGVTRILDWHVHSNTWSAGRETRDCTVAHVPPRPTQDSQISRALAGNFSGTGTEHRSRSDETMTQNCPACTSLTALWHLNRPRTNVSTACICQIVPTTLAHQKWHNSTKISNAIRPWKCHNENAMITSEDKPQLKQTDPHNIDITMPDV